MLVLVECTCTSNTHFYVSIIKLLSCFHTYERYVMTSVVRDDSLYNCPHLAGFLVMYFIKRSYLFFGHICRLLIMMGLQLKPYILNYNSHKPNWFQLFYFCPLHSFVAIFIAGGKIAMSFPFFVCWLNMCNYLRIVCLEQWFPTGVPRYPGVPWTLPRGTARCRNNKCFIVEIFWGE